MSDIATPPLFYPTDNTCKQSLKSVGLSFIMYALSTSFVGITMKECFDYNDKNYMSVITAVSFLISFILLFFIYKEYKKNNKITIEIGLLVIIVISLIVSSSLMIYNLTQLDVSKDKDICLDDSVKKTLRISSMLNLGATIIFSHVAIMYYGLIQ